MMKFFNIIVGLSSMLNFAESVNKYILIHDLQALKNVLTLPERTWKEFPDYDNTEFIKICNEIKTSRLIYSQTDTDSNSYYIRRISAIISEDENLTEFGKTSVLYKDDDEISIPVIYCETQNFTTYIAKNNNYDYYFLLGNRPHEDYYTDSPNSSNDENGAELGHDYEDKYYAIPLAVIRKYVPLTNAVAFNFEKRVSSLHPMHLMYNVKLVEVCASAFYCLSPSDAVISAISAEIKYHKRPCDKLKKSSGSKNPCIPTLECIRDNAGQIPDEKLLIQYNVKSMQLDKILSKVCYNNIVVDVSYPLSENV